MNKGKSLIEIRTGSHSDIPKIRKAYEFLDSLGTPYSSESYYPRILSAHRTPQRMFEEARKLRENGFYVSISAAGGSAHLPGMTASETTIPVIGLPVKSETFRGKEALYSMIQMPEGVPVGTVGIGQAESAAILAAQIAYVNDVVVRNRIREKRGLKLDRLSSLRPDNNLVGIITPSNLTFPNEEKYTEILDIFNSFKIEYKNYSISVVDDSGLEKASEEVARDGGKALIAIGALADENTTNYFPRMVAEKTDLPVIGLLIANGYAGGGDYIQGDIFQAMLQKEGYEDDEIIGIPIAGMGVNRFKNAALFAAQIIGLHDSEIRNRVHNYRKSLAEGVREKDEIAQREGIKGYL